jgi:hypothetical protein
MPYHHEKHPFYSYIHKLCEIMEFSYQGRIPTSQGIKTCVAFLFSLCMTALETDDTGSPGVLLKIKGEGLKILQHIIWVMTVMC